MKGPPNIIEREKKHTLLAHSRVFYCDTKTVLYFIYLGTYTLDYLSSQTSSEAATDFVALPPRV